MEQAMSRRNPLRLDQVLRALLAFIIGVLLFTALVSAFSRIAGIEAPPPGGKKPVEMVLCLAAAMLLAGYGTARLARRWQVLVSAGLGGLMSIGAGPAHLHWQGIEGSLATMLSLLVMPPAAVFGGLVAGMMARSQAQKRAAQPLQLPLVFQQKLALTWLGFVLALGMVAVGMWAVRQEGAPPRLWTGVFFFGAAVLLLGWAALRPKPQAILSEQGLEILAWRVMIPWLEIEGATPSRTHPIEYVRFQVRDAERYIARLTEFQRAVTQAGELEPNIGIVLTGTPYRAEEVCALVRRQIDAMDGFAHAASLPLS